MASLAIYLLELLLLIAFFDECLAGCYCDYLDDYYCCPDNIYCCKYGFVCADGACITVAIILVPIAVVLGIVILVVFCVCFRRKNRQQQAGVVMQPLNKPESTCPEGYPAHPETYPQPPGGYQTQPPMYQQQPGAYPTGPYQTQTYTAPPPEIKA